MKPYEVMLLVSLLITLESCAGEPKPLVMHLTNPSRDTAVVIDNNDNFFEQQLQLNVRATLSHDALLETSTLIWKLKDGESKPDAYQHTYYRIPKNETITILQDLGDEHTVNIKPLGTNKGTLDITIYLPAPRNADPGNSVGTDSLLRKPLAFSKNLI